MDNRKFESFSSSTAPEQLANTVRGGILAVPGIIVFAAVHVLGLNVIDSDVTSFAAAAGTIAGGVWTIYGLIQKIVVAFAQH